MAEGNPVELLAYFAGFFDGEGTIVLNRGFSHHGRPKYTLSVKVANTDPEIIYEMKTIWGGSVHLKIKERTHHKQAYFWNVGCTNARKFLRDVMPYLKLKKKQAIIALRFGSVQSEVNRLRRERGAKSRYTESEYKQLAILRTDLLNERGGSHNRLVYPEEMVHVG